MIYGCDYLGAVHYESQMLATHPTGWAGGLFLRTFGDARNTLQYMCASGKFSEILVHLAPFDHSHQYPVAKYLPQIKLDAAWIEAMPKNNTVILLSPFCENNYHGDVMSPIFDSLRQIAPSCLMVQSGSVIPGVITDRHLANSHNLQKPTGAYVVSFDGFGSAGDGNFTDTDIQKILTFFSDARHIRLWDFRYNGKFSHNDTSDENHRTNWPDLNYLLGHNAMMKVREGELSYPKTALYKPFAEDHGGNDPKANRALIILPHSGQHIPVADSQGNRIDVMTRVMPDFVGTPKGARFYSTKYAYQLGNLAQKNTGSRLIKIDGLPLIDADLRSNYFK